MAERPFYTDLEAPRDGLESAAYALGKAHSALLDALQAYPEGAPARPRLKIERLSNSAMEVLRTVGKLMEDIPYNADAQIVPTWGKLSAFKLDADKLHYETGEMTREEQIGFFSYLIAEGLIGGPDFKEGPYLKTAAAFISSGIIAEDGTINPPQPGQSAEAVLA